MPAPAAGSFESRAPDLVLGPMLRYVDDRSATVWVETDAPCDVSVLGHSAGTFSVEGHHYALVLVEGLEPGTSTPYEVELDGVVRWPPRDYEFPPSVIRTLGDGPLRFAFGSCRASVPHEPPYTLSPGQHPQAFELDSLRAYALRLLEGDGAPWPTAFFFLGDQVYADELPPGTAEFIRSRRSLEEPPGLEVADFEEYTVLYREAWQAPLIRWLLSTVPSAMIFDDHDIIDDWNISAAWIGDMRIQPWWRDRIVGGLTAYWVYQHLGNLSPDELRRDDLYRRVLAFEDATAVLREFALEADRDPDTARWSYVRDFGQGTRLLVVDSRAARVFGGRERDMLDEAEWEWLAEQVGGGADHLILASSLPVLMAPGIDWLERWNAAVCDGAWGRAGAWLGERIRRAIDLEHWPAFPRSFERLTALLAERGASEGKTPPSTITIVSGDVHYSYLAEALFPDGTAVTSRVHQVTCSPLRNAIGGLPRRVQELGFTGRSDRIGRWLARSAGVGGRPLEWRVHVGPAFENMITSLDIDAREACVRFEQTTGTHERPGLRVVGERRLDAG